MINKTDIKFTNEEQTLLNKGLKYSLGHKHKLWITNLVLEAENFVTLLPLEEKDYMHYQVKTYITTLCNKTVVLTYVI